MVPMPPSAVPYAQYRNDCTTGELEQWRAKIRRSDADFLPTDLRALSGAYRHYPPCLGCGRPTGDYGEALRVDETAKTATFQPCGCTLQILDPPILDYIPAGTRPDRCLPLMLHADLVDDPAAGDNALAWARETLIRECPTTPHVILLLDQAGIERHGIPSLQPLNPTQRMLGAIWLAALPGQTEHIVLRASEALRNDPAAAASVDGRWEQRAGIFSGSLVRLALPAGSGTATARPTGGIEIRDDGAVAEVYQLTADHWH